MRAANEISLKYMCTPVEAHAAQLLDHAGVSEFSVAEDLQLCEVLCTGRPQSRPADQANAALAGEMPRRWRIRNKKSSRSTQKKGGRQYPKAPF